MDDEKSLASRREGQGGDAPVYDGRRDSTVPSRQYDDEKECEVATFVLPVHRVPETPVDDDTTPSNVPGSVVAALPLPEPAGPSGAGTQRSSLQTFVIMAGLCISVFLAALDVTIITTALPVMSEALKSDAAGYTWIGSAYLLANAASTPSWGKLSDIWGRKPILLVAAAVFFVGSATAGASISIAMLIAARAIQGIGGGGLIILANICISDLFPLRSRGKYFGMIGMVWATASGVGPILGGVFTEKVSWRWCFYINLPITGAAFMFLLCFLHLDTPRTPLRAGLKAVDWLGSLGIVGGTLMLLLGLEFGGITFPWNSPTVICLIVFGVLVGGLFVLNEWKYARFPIMPVRLFRSPSSVASLAVCFMHGFVFIAGSYYLPLYFQAVLGATPLLSGVYLLPFVLSLSICSALTGTFIKRTGKYRPPIWGGLAVMTVGFGLFIDLEPKPNWAKIIIFQIIAGIGVGPNFQSPLIALQTQVEPCDIATATATFGFTRNLSTAISVVIGGVVFQNQMEQKYQSLVAALGAAAANLLNGGNAGANVGVLDSLPPAQRSVTQQAFFESLRTMWILYVAFSATGLFISFFISSTKLSRTHEAPKTGLGLLQSQRAHANKSRHVGNGVADAV